MRLTITTSIAGAKSWSNETRQDMYGFFRITIYFCETGFTFQTNCRNCCGNLIVCRLYSTFIRLGLSLWWFPSLVSILHLQLLKRPVSFQPQNNKMFDFSMGSVFKQCDKAKNTELLILIKYILNSNNQFIFAP